jgi:UDP-glucose 4-epimerase
MSVKGKVLVTGGAGYIGSHTAVELLEAGYEVVIADNFSNSEPFILDRIRTITGKDFIFEEIDLADKAAVEKFFEKYNDLSGIIHFAANKAVGESVEKPLLYYRNNLLSLIFILEGMLKNGIGNLVFSSSCTVYGQPETLPVDEDAPMQKAESPYGNTKQICEEIIADIAKANPHLKTLALRYFNPIGAHDSGLIGELPRGIPSNLIPFVTQTAIGLRNELKVFGNDYNTPDGSCIRDYIHVVDLAKAHVIAVDRLLTSKNKKSFEWFNLGTGKGVSVLEVVKTYEKVTGVTLNYQIVGRRAGDIEQVWADTRYANEELGWKAKHTLDVALKSAWKWEQNIRKKQGTNESD